MPCQAECAAGAVGALALQERGLRVWGPVTGPTGYALVSLRCMLWGCQQFVHGVGVACHREGRRRLGPPPLPAARPLGRQSGSAAHRLWMRVCGRGYRALAP